MSIDDVIRDLRRWAMRVEQPYVQWIDAIEAEQARVRELEERMQEIADLRGEDVAIARTAVWIAEAALAGRREET
jgi:hypothetical protein